MNCANQDQEHAFKNKQFLERALKTKINCFKFHNWIYNVQYEDGY